MIDKAKQKRRRATVEAIRKLAQQVITVTAWTSKEEEEFNESVQDALYERAFSLVKAIELLE
jgi:hypothetical protein